MTLWTGASGFFGGLIALLVFANAIRGLDEIIGRRPLAGFADLVKRVKAFGVFHQALDIGSGEPVRQLDDLRPIETLQFGWKVSGVLFEYPHARRGIRNLHFEPEFHSSGADKGGGQMAQIHGCHHYANPRCAFAFKAVEHRQQVTIKTPLLAILENCIRVVDEDHGRRVVPGRFEDATYTLMEVVGTRDEGAVHQKEFAAQPAPARVRWWFFRYREGHTAVRLVWAGVPDRSPPRRSRAVERYGFPSSAARRPHPRGRPGRHPAPPTSRRYWRGAEIADS